MSKNGFAPVWFGVLPRLGGVMTTAAVMVIVLGAETGSRYLSALVWVYLISLPFAVFLTLPPPSGRAK
ncbi:MAG: hypothetical protein LBN39_08110 [Planctomycetaceae bacterium]|nr:hypothetical protein [Planctomycetaceae bacterium]